MTRVLVTGARGFIGQHVVAALIDRGVEVHALTSKGMTLGREVHWHRGDIFDGETLGSILKEIKPTHLVHAAWFTEPGLYLSSSENIRWVRASIDLAEAFLDCGGSRFVGIGSCAEYAPSVRPCKESVTPLGPISLYGNCKHALNTILASYLSGNGISYAWARVFYLFGPGEPKSRLVPTIVQNILQGKAVQLTGGTQIRDFLFAPDVGAAIATLVVSDVTGPVNIGSGTECTVRQLATAFADKLGGRDLLVFGAIAAKPNESPVTIADTRRLRDEVGWPNVTSKEVAIERTVKWWSGQL